MRSTDSYLLGLRDVSEDIDADLLAAIGGFFGEDFRPVRFLQIRAGSLADRVALVYSPRARAFAWGRNVLFPARCDAIWREPWRRENARTIAHELWHVRELHEFGLIRWCWLFLSEWRRYGLRGMRLADHEIRAREAAEAFVESAAYQEGRLRDERRQAGSLPHM
ncbi:MAG: DUF4157 domain-containing protein [Armatimonadota bacterium]